MDIVALLWKAVHLAETLVYFIVVISMIATIHEYGHYILCKILGVRVEEFSIGFGKLLWGRQWGETFYCVRWIPIAAYVRPAGMDPAEAEQEGYIDPGERSFNRKNSFVKHAILLGGSVFNVISALFFLTLLYGWYGHQKTTVEVNRVTDGGPAHRGGVMPGDVFVEIEGQPIDDAMLAIAHIKRNPGKPVKIRVRRGEHEKDCVVTPDNVGGSGRVMMEFKPKALSKDPVKVGWGEAFTVASRDTWAWVTMTYRSALEMLGNAFSRREVPKEVGGPIAIVSSVSSVVEQRAGVQGFLHLLHMLSMAIGVFNLLPVPALDGGRILILLIKDVLDVGYLVILRKRPDESVLSHKIEEFVHVAGFMFLLFLLVVVSYKDVTRLLWPEKETLPNPISAPSASPRPSPAALPSPLPSPSPAPSPSPSPGR